MSVHKNMYVHMHRRQFADTFGFIGDIHILYSVISWFVP